jgi:hypothetical protein
MWAAIAKPACWAVKWVHAQEPRPKMAAKTKPCLSQPEAEVNDSAGLGIGEPVRCVWKWFFALAHSSIWGAADYV